MAETRNGPHPEAQKTREAGSDSASGNKNGRLKSRKRQEVKADGTIIKEEEEYYEGTEPVVSSNTEPKDSAEAKPNAPEAAKSETSKTGEPKLEKKAEEPAKKETAETKKEDHAGSKEVVEAAKSAHDAPKEVKETLEKPENAKAAAEAIDNTPTFGEKTKNFFRRFGTGFLAGMAARAGVKFFVKRSLDFGAVGTGAIAGGVAGGAIEAAKTGWQEHKRLLDLQTYKDALAGYESMTDLDKVTAVIALEKKLKHQFNNRTIKPAEHAELQALYLDLRTRLERVVGKEIANKDDAEKIKHLIEIRKGVEVTNPEKPAKGVKEKLKRLRDRVWADREDLLATAPVEVKAQLEKFYKERDLEVNWKRIGLNTLKGVAVGAAGGALGGFLADYAIEHSTFLQEHFGHPNVVHAAGPGGGGGGIHSAAVEAGHNAAAVKQAAAEAVVDAKKSLVEASDIRHVKSSVWATVADYFKERGIEHPSNKLINEGMIRISEINHIEITGHHDVADFGNFHHAHMGGAGSMEDIKMTGKEMLKGFASLDDLVKEGGGKTLQMQAEETAKHLAEQYAAEYASHLPKTLPGGEAGAKLIKEAADEMGFQEKYLKWISAVMTTGTVGAGGYYGIKKFRKIMNEDGENGPSGPDGGETQESKTKKIPVELIGDAEEIKNADLNRRMELLSQIKVEALGRLAKVANLLEGENPDIKGVIEALNSVGAIYNDEQLKHLCQGANSEDTEEIEAAWKKTGEELEVLLVPLKEKIAKLLEESKKLGVQSEADEIDTASFDDDDSAEETQVSTGTKTGPTKVEKGPGWLEVYQPWAQKLKDLILQGEQFLEKNNFDQAEERLMEGEAVLAELDKFAEGLDDKAKKFAKKQVKTLRESLNGLEEKIKQARKNQPKVETQPQAETTPQSEEKQSREEQAKKIGIEPWQVSHYKRMVSLKLIAPVAEGEKFYAVKGNQDRFNKFLLFTKEKGGPFEKLTAGGAKELRTQFFSSLTQLKEGNSGPLEAFCAKILTKGNQLKKVDSAKHILAEMKHISFEVRQAVERAEQKFKAA